MDRCSCLIYSWLKGARVHPGNGMKDRTRLLESVLAADVCQLFRFELLSCRNDIAAGLWPGHALNGPIPCHLSDHFSRPDSLTPEETKKPGKDIQRQYKNKIAVIIAHFPLIFFLEHHKVPLTSPQRTSLSYLLYGSFGKRVPVGPVQSFPDCRTSIVVLEKLHVFNIH